MKITAAIPTYARPDGITRLFESMLRQERVPDEVLVIDASPDDATKQVAERYAATLPVRYILSGKGLTRQRNRAIEEATGDVVAFFDDDVVFESGFFSAMESVFNQNSDIAGVGGFIVNEWGKTADRWWPLRKGVGLLPGKFATGRALPYGIGLPLSTLQPFIGLCDVDWIPGGVSAWRREIFKEFVFSTFFSDYGLAEDKEFSIRVSRQHRLVICGDARLHHLKYPSGRPKSFWMGYYHVHNHTYLLSTCFPDQPWWRHYQQLWYWVFESMLNLAGGIVTGGLKLKSPSTLGMLWGVTTHLLPARKKQTHV